MNTKTILSAIVTLMLSLNIYAAEPRTMRNEMVTESGKQVELIVFVDGSNELQRRTLSHYDTANVLTEKVTYEWSSFRGWRPVSRLQYNYNDAKALSTVAHTKWSERKNDWNAKSDIVRYDVAGDGSVLVAEVK